jgi:hypothetical protein
VGSAHDTNEQRLSAYQNAAAPRHAVNFHLEGYSHYSYFDGLCHNAGGGGSALHARTQRVATVTALRSFFDHYLRDEPLDPDLGLSGYDSVLMEVCMDAEVDGADGGDRCE